MTCVYTSPNKPKPHLSLLSKFLTVWIFLAMALGVAIGYIYPKVSSAIGSLSIGTTSIPIAIGLILMMYPPLARVRYEDLKKVVTAKGSKTMLTESLTLNWVIGPLLMFVLAWVFLGNYPDLRNGIILIGIARCIAMVIVWNNLAEGDNEWTAILVAINSIFQIVMYSVLAYFYITIASSWISGSGQVVNISLIQVAAVSGDLLRNSFLRRNPNPILLLKNQRKRMVRSQTNAQTKPSVTNRVAIHNCGHVLTQRAIHRKSAVGCCKSRHSPLSLLHNNVHGSIRHRALLETGLQKNNLALFHSC